MLVREFAGGDPPHTCRVVFLDQPAGFGHRVTDEGREVEHVTTRPADFAEAVAAKIAEGYAETGWSLTRRVFVTDEMFWIVALDGDTLRTQFGRIRVDWRPASGEAREREFRDAARAAAAYLRAIAAKCAEGYREEYARPVFLDELPPAPKTSGKGKSR